MIQRIQTIWLLLAAGCFLAQWMPALVLASTPSEGLGVFADKVFWSGESFVVLMGSGVSGILVLISVLYKERVMQILLVAVSSLIQMIMGVGVPFT
ncbi:MAG: DUF4293 family protein [Saprospiraceae bacterium]|nr:DUF4293 family protein [Saprospiraceae bacterium]